MQIVLGIISSLSYGERHKAGVPEEPDGYSLVGLPRQAIQKQ